jgi:DNA-binding MarR family transcriptional regulator
VPTATDAQLTAFIEAFDEFVRAAKQARACFEREDEVSPAQLDLLLPLLEADGPLALGALAKAAGITPPTATRMADGLQARGLLRRERSLADRRAVLLSLTAEGEDAARATRARVLARRRAIFEQLAPTERRAAAKVLARLADAYAEFGA